MSNGPFPGRRESFGIGKEATPGTSVVPAVWLPHLALTLDPKTTQIQNNSALGRLEDVNDSAVVAEWAEGSVQAKVTDTAIGYLFYNLFGTATTALHAGETTVYDTTFTVNSTSLGPSLTFARINPLGSRRYALGEVTDFELDVTQGDWAKFTASLTAKIGATAADTAAYPAPAETEFTSKHTVVKYASTVAGLNSGTVLDVKSIKLKVTSKVDKWVPFGAIDPTSFDQNEFNVTATIVLRYADTTVELLANANTRQALSISLINNDVTIGSSAHPSLVLTAPKVRFAPIQVDNNLKQVLNQTVAVTFELDTSAGSMISAVLTNMKNGY